MLISQIAVTQAELKPTDLFEIEDMSAVGESKKILGSKINPMTALADIIVGGAGGIVSRLGIGLANQQLFVNAAGDGLEYGYGSKVVAYTRDMTLAGGDVAYAGAGFKPRSIIVLSEYTTSISIGFGDIATTKYVLGLYGASLGTPYLTSSYILFLIEDAANTKNQTAVLKSIDIDGCTLTWAKLGAPAAGIGNFVILYLR
jgi:hypothetical protein